MVKMESVLTILESKTVKTFPHGIVKTYEFYTRSEGYKIAGSCAIWTQEVFGYRFFVDGSSHGKFSTNKEEMKSLYDNLGKMNKAQYKDMTGQENSQDDLDRVNCPHAGEIGHKNCGWCWECGTPAFLCTCTRTV